MVDYISGSSALALHKEIHSDRKEACPVCGKLFTDKAKVNITSPSKLSGF